MGLIVATVLRGKLAGRPPDGADVWSGEIEHHFALVAARNLMRALDLAPATSVSVNPTLRAELIEGRDLHEHWPENLPVFNVTPRVAQPRYPSGKNFADRNPDRGPYWWLGWSNKTGAQLLPHVSAAALHQLLDAVEAEVLANDDSLITMAARERRVVAEGRLGRVPTPLHVARWRHHDGGCRRAARSVACRNRLPCRRPTRRE